MLSCIASPEYGDKGLRCIARKVPIETEAQGKPIKRLHCHPDGASDAKLFFMGRVAASMNGQSIGSKQFVDAGPVG
eukprot:3949138-Pyramimonas_sp.AAC.1